MAYIFGLFNVFPGVLAFWSVKYRSVFTFTARGFFTFVLRLFRFLCRGTRLCFWFLVCLLFYLVGSCFNFFLFPFTSMSTLGEGNNEPTPVRVADPPEVSDGSAAVLDTSLPLNILADLQRQIKTNHALVQSLREELRQDRLTRSSSHSLGHRSPSIVSVCVQEDVPLVPRASGIPEDSISLFAKESSLQGTTAQEASFRHPTSLDLDVEPYLSRPQVDSHTPGFSENVLYVADLLQLPKRKDDSASFRNMSEQLLSSEAEARSTSSLPPSHSVAHWLKETNSRLRGSEDTKVLKQHKDALQAHHKGMVGSEVFSSTRHKIFPSSSYRMHDHVVEPTPQVLDADHVMLGSAETSVTIKASEFKAIESLIRSSLSVLSYIEHFDVASTKLLQQLLSEVGQGNQESRSPRAQMLLNLKLSQARALSHLANIEAKLLGNVVLARRDSFLARSKVAGDQQLKNYLRTTPMTHTSLFAGQVTPVAKELAERRRRPLVFQDRRATGSSTPAGQQSHSPSSWSRAYPARPRNSRQTLPVSSTRSTPAKRGGQQSSGAPAKKLRSGPKNL